MNKGSVLYHADSLPRNALESTPVDRLKGCELKADATIRRSETFGLSTFSLSTWVTKNGH